MNRRSLLLGIGAALAAPAIVRAESLMKLWVPPRNIERLAHLTDIKLDIEDKIVWGPCVSAAYSDMLTGSYRFILNEIEQITGIDHMREVRSRIRGISLALLQ